MSELKHTPGPWEFHELEIGKVFEPVYGLTRACDGGPLPVYVMASVDKPENETAKANAYLIAAAPELLAACELAVSWMPMNSKRRIVEKIIAKAKGEQ